MQKNSMLVKALVDRGDHIAIEHGRAVIVPKSGKPVPEDWLQKNNDLICQQIVEATGVQAYRYDHYTTGSYRVEAYKGKGTTDSGVTLHYVNILTYTSLRISYNVNLTRARNTKTGKKGARLPKGQFRVGKIHAFTRFWQRLRLPLPNRLSAFHDRMGKLNAVLINVDLKSNGKVDKDSVQPLNISYDVITQSIAAQKLPDNIQTSSEQHPDNIQTKKADKEFTETQTRRAIQPNPSTCKKKYELSNKEQRVTELNNTVIPFPEGKRPEEQTNEEWMNVYDHASEY